MTAVATDPRLVFRMIGTWWRIELSSPEAIADSTKQIARGVLGRADDRASARARLRDELTAAATAAADAEAQLLMIQTELGPGEPMSATLTVFEDERMRMSPTVGTAPDAVLATLERSFPLIDAAAAETLVRRQCRDSEVVRVHTVQETVQIEDGEQYTQRRLVAQYWYPIPGSKRLLTVVLSSPLGEIPNTLLSYFDAIVSASAFQDA
ncbi:MULTISPECIES: hypothetical protein [unclassified Microbacterium]|uniref:hypothetical protein n=1 Tax=unclassified Microbacterium TaxID=2609290 RepID=UPI00214CB23D|nr:MULTISPECIES: hypothetical protein [unclassified Microbacterium]MCR2784260.1 hypothetical protein [Microbacterium sp. zg.B96]MDL5350832.1 hypothetical protein [Microbacterium sp. zg-YB36]WIM14911.1 hypothetical protein QNO11_10125 [Microbacterium sp. zg-B96]